jgi:hypothetical protein
MNIYWKKLGGHIHMRVFINGAKMGDLCCRESEWKEVQAGFSILHTHIIPDAEEVYNSPATEDRTKDLSS